MTAIQSREQVRAASLGMTLDEYLRWRKGLRADYARIGKSAKGVHASLAYGTLFPLFDSDAKLDVNIVTRMPSDAELIELRATPVMWRKRRPGESIIT